jgi:hypothetical protein
MVKHNKNFGRPLDSEHRKRISDALKGNTNKKGTHHSEETKAKIRDAHLGLKHTEETKTIIKMKRANQICSEETRKKMSESHKGTRNHNYGKPLSKERREYLSQINSGHNNPAYGTEGHMAGKHHSIETKERMRELQLIIQNTPEVKKHKSEMLSGEKNPNWNGGPKDYCVKFKYGTFRNRCRAYFDNVCVLCGQPAGDETLDVHHVYYNKKACCEVSEDGKYYSDLGIKGAPKTFEIIGDPNKFVPLHHKCHSLTTPKPVREHYARHFEKVINEQYEGKCYYTEEEYAELCEPETPT